ncbi:MAG: DUF2141 domain-containing protein [Marinicaulis sp.]|nr:DUF2141 domain-containing protein [Marinicaulis sp.]NNL90227.1 DUF2141 domain-containing protein [Marinicaulis sp.]
MRLRLRLVRLTLPAGLLLTATPSTVFADSAPEFDFLHVSCNGGENEIRVIIENVEKSVGLVAADLYLNNEETFLKPKQRVKQVRFAAREPFTAYCMTAPEPGLYAIALYHDRNANGSLDRTGLGLPAEPWGISNNPRVRFSAPHVSKAIFEVTADGAKVAIRLR